MLQLQKSCHNSLTGFFFHISKEKYATKIHCHQISKIHTVIKIRVADDVTVQLRTQTHVFSLRK